MRIFKRLKFGFGMARRSGGVLSSYPKLQGFPLIGGFSGIATLFGSLLLTDSVQDPGLILYGALFVAYLVETLVALFFMPALVATTCIIFHGEEPSIRRSLAVA